MTFYRYTSMAKHVKGADLKVELGRDRSDGWILYRTRKERGLLTQEMSETMQQTHYNQQLFKR